MGRISKQVCNGVFCVRERERERGPFRILYPKFPFMCSTWKNKQSILKVFERECKVYCTWIQKTTFLFETK